MRGGTRCIVLRPTMNKADADGDFPALRSQDAASRLVGKVFVQSSPSIPRTDV